MYTYDKFFLPGGVSSTSSSNTFPEEDDDAKSNVATGHGNQEKNKTCTTNYMCIYAICSEMYGNLRYFANNGSETFFYLSEWYRSKMLKQILSESSILKPFFEKLV